MGLLRTYEDVVVLLVRRCAWWRREEGQSLAKYDDHDRRLGTA
jgi:hypothetical protein